MLSRLFCQSFLNVQCTGVCYFSCVLKEQVKYSEQANQTQVFMYIKGTLLHILQKRMIQRKMGQASD